jgi:hypothetical protein
MLRCGRRRAGRSAVGELVELATAEHVDWFNIRRLQPAIGGIPPPERDSAYHAQTSPMTRPSSPSAAAPDSAMTGRYRPARQPHRPGRTIPARTGHQRPPQRAQLGPDRPRAGYQPRQGLAPIRPRIPGRRPELAIRPLDEISATSIGWRKGNAHIVRIRGTLQDRLTYIGTSMRANYGQLITDVSHMLFHHCCPSVAEHWKSASESKWKRRSLLLSQVRGSVM